MKFRLSINVEIVKISGKFKFNTQHLIIYPVLINVKMPTVVGILTFMSRINLIVGILTFMSRINFSLS